MFNFIKACEIAQEELVKNWCKKGIGQIIDAGDRWLFCGIPDEDSGPYGNCPIAVDKETGKAEGFSISANMDLYYNSPLIEVPKEFYIAE